MRLVYEPLYAFSLAATSTKVVCWRPDQHSDVGNHEDLLMYHDSQGASAEVIGISSNPVLEEGNPVRLVCRPPKASAPPQMFEHHPTVHTHGELLREDAATPKI